MTKKLFFILSLAVAACFTPAAISETQARIELSDIDVQQTSITQNGSHILISGAAGKTAYVYNLIGIQVMAIHLDSPSQHIDLSNLPKGIYPIKVGNYTKKIRL